MRISVNWCVRFFVGVVYLQATVAVGAAEQDGVQQILPDTIKEGAAAVAPESPPALTRELVALIQERKLTELRTIYNGPFSAALFFDPVNIEYYVALLKGNDFWWISKTKSDEEAEALYWKMATHTMRLSMPSLEKIKLDARIAVTQKKLVEAQQKRQQLAEQVGMQNRVLQEGTAAQVQLNKQVASMAQQRDALQRSLDAANAMIQTLQSEAKRGPDVNVSWPDEAKKGGSTRGDSSALSKRQPVFRTNALPVEPKNSVPGR